MSAASLPSLPPTQGRSALQRLPDVAAQESLEPPPLAEVFVPGSHHKALSLDATLVVGMRGAGKSLWTAVLLSPTHRRFVADQIGNAPLASAEVRVGFGLDTSNQQFPSKRIIDLLSQHCSATAIWQLVLLRHAVSALGEPLPPEISQWERGATWVQAHPAEVDAELARCDEALASNKRVLLVLFDALDRLASEWSKARPLLRDALELALSCRSRRAIRMKLFLRPDMEEDPEIWRFADSSKLRHSKVDLAWKPSELYGLVLSHMLNDSIDGSALRDRLSKALRMTWPTVSNTYLLPAQLVGESARLRLTIEALVGPWMGRDKKRGYTYTWIPLHLADAKGRVSPRSFLLALKRGAEFTAEAHPEHRFALHYEGINEGVVEASRIRIEEIKEDYPWVEPLLEAARGLEVPCTTSDLAARWQPEQLAGASAAPSKLPPRRFTTDPVRRGTMDGLIDDLIELAVLYRADDGRLNMPDIFRVGFGIKRRGGVRPIRL